MRKIWGHLLFPFKFKFKLVLTTVNYCIFCLFRFGKMMFNFKFKLILRKKKIYVNNFLRNFQLPMPVELILPVGQVDPG